MLPKSDLRASSNLHMNASALASYLSRISYRGEQAPTPSTLAALHRAHLAAIPFENLDIHTGSRIHLEPLALFTKLVTNRRGGFCYEQNGLFAEVLTTLGFDVTLLSARVANAAGDYSPPFDHLTLLVNTDGRWLADVGFGRSFHEPLSLDRPNESEAEGSFYRAVPTAEGFRVESREPGGSYKPEYAFDLTPHPLSDFEPRCRFHETSPDSHFQRNIVCSRPTGRGRITVTGRALLVLEDGVHHETPLPDRAAVFAALAEHFDIRLDLPLRDG
jgi:N-hydroxyarylamine O-acetyltransferase